MLQVTSVTTVVDSDIIPTFVMDMFLDSVLYMSEPPVKIILFPRFAEISRSGAALNPWILAWRAA